MKIRSENVAGQAIGSDTATARPQRAELVEAIRSLIVEQCGHRPEHVLPESRVVLDLGIDSLELVELILSIEEEFSISIPNPSPRQDPVFQSVFTRPDFSVRDMAETVFLLWGHPPRPERKKLWRSLPAPAGNRLAPFSQLDGMYQARAGEGRFERLENLNAEGFSLYRRRSDGMACVEIPAAEAVEIDGEMRSVKSFLIDVEPVSTTAYARYLRSIGPVDSATLALWFDLPDWDKRRGHLPLVRVEDSCGAESWAPRPGGESWPMMLVSWFGANAYALWANGEDWRNFREQSPFLPSLLEFEFAARGSEPRCYPWGDQEPDESLANVARLEFRRNYRFAELPLSPVNECIGLSPFGLRHMAGNVWHWCRDWRDPQEKRIRCEKGGSWVGPAELARCSYHRGRPPEAKGRCLGFRCVRPMADTL